MKSLQINLLYFLLCSLVGVLHADGVKGSNGIIKFDVDSDTTEEMVLNANGLGVGITPSANLHVQGNAIVSGSFNIGSNSNASSNLHVSGTLGYETITISSDQTLSSSSFVMVNSSSDNVKITLPYAGNMSGRMYNIKRLDTTNQVWLTSDNLIDGFQHLALSQTSGSYASIEVISDGTNWYKLSAVNVSEPWTPSQLTTTIWLDADDATTVSANASELVSALDDKSGNSNDFSQSTDNNKPTRVSINDRLGLQFNGTSSTMTSSAQLQNVVSSGNEVSIYFALPSVTTAEGLFHARGATARVQMRSSTQWFIGTYDGSDPGTGGLTSIVGGMQRDDSDNVSFSVNGTFSANTYTDTTTLQDTPTINIGASDGHFYDGIFGELVVTPSHLSTTDRQKLEGYFAHKWGLTDELPNTHPHKVIPPFQ